MIITETITTKITILRMITMTVMMMIIITKLNNNSNDNEKMGKEQE